MRARTPLGIALAGARTADDLGVEVAADYGDPDGEYRAVRETVAMIDRSARGSVLVDGRDALSFLQSLVSQDLEGLGSGEGVHTLLLQPQGKLEVDFRLLRVDDESWLDCEMGEGEHLTRALNRFRIRVEVTIEDRSVEWGQVAVRGPHAVAAVGVALELTVPETLHAHAGWNDARVVRADWPGAPGVDIVGPLATVEAAWRALFDAGIAPAGIDAYEAVRIEAGVPRQGKDIDGATIPQEAFLERDAVSFTKGCFLGQELVCRIDTRGHVNRYLRGLRVLDAVRPPEGAEIIVGDRVVGAVTSVAQSLSLRAPVALGMVRRDVEVPSAATVRWDGAEARAEVRALPLVP